jgi:prolycopene isomerase
MNFALYAAMVYRYLSGGGWIPKHRSHEISLAMESCVRALGGEIWYSTRAEKILVENGTVCGVETTAGSVSCQHVIANCSPHTVFGSMIDPNQIPERQMRAVNARKLGMRGLVVYLGLNKSAGELGLNDYSYFVYGTMDTVKEVERTRSFNDHPMMAAVCLNQANPDCSPEGTSILSLTTLYGEEVWGEVQPENYVAKKREVAERMIRYFERSVGVSVMPYIEEIEIATPATLARYTENPQGAIYAYEYNDWDTLIPRLMMVKEDQIIEGLRFAGGYGPRGYGYNGTYLGGEFAAKLTRGDMGRA